MGKKNLVDFNTFHPSFFFFLLPINTHIVSRNYKAHYHTKRIILKFKNASHNLKLLFSNMAPQRS